MSALLSVAEASTELIAAARAASIVRTAETKYGPAITIAFATSLPCGSAVVPFAVYASVTGRAPNRALRYSKLASAFTGELRDYQRDLRVEAIGHLNRMGSCLVQMHCGAGKSHLAASIAVSAGLRCCIVVHRVVLAGQWRETLETCTTAAVQIVAGGAAVREDADIVVMRANDVLKRDPRELRSFGTVVVDECHAYCSPSHARVWARFTPRYLVGLSATPERPDGMHVVLDLYLGLGRVVKEMHREHDVACVKYEPQADYSQFCAGGRLDWSRVLDAQALDARRNALIVAIVGRLLSRRIIILCKRRDQCYLLHESVTRAGHTCSVYTGTSKSPNLSTRVFVTTYAKAGVGLDHTALDTAILATDVKEFIAQYHGRIFRRADTRPLLVDIVDTFGPCISHYARTRAPYYRRVGGVVANVGELRSGASIAEYVEHLSRFDGERARDKSAGAEARASKRAAPSAELAQRGTGGEAALDHTE